MTHFVEKWPSPLIELNQFDLASSGVYRANDESEFAYSDGQSVEQQLHKILSEADSLDSDSAELEAQITDWPTEYHLSSARANLIRPLDLSGVERVLELGCGCGAISRYLGEHAHIQVDSVEGSHARAALAALRCRDQANVVVSQGNFNSLALPENYYDLVLFVGVTEYAGRFSDKESDEQALQELLQLAHRACKQDGATLIAIENRLGLKYLLGASEDHYGEPWVGVDDYPQSTGIKTYSYDQWQQHIAASPFESQQFCYPFPDYKVPNLLINDSASLDEQALVDVVSRDYLRPFESQHLEAQLWRGIVQANTLAQFSNSYLILLSDSSERLSALSAFDVAQYANQPMDWHNASPQPSAKPATKSSSKQDAALRNELQNLAEHAGHLERKVSMLENSKGGKLLSFLRRLVKRNG